MKFLLPLLAVAGAVLISAGFALIYPPAGLLAAGGFCLAAGLLINPRR